MTTLFGRAPERSHANEDPPSLRLSGLQTRRRPLQAVLSVALVLVSLAVFVGLYTRADHQQPVVVVTSTVYPGQRIAAGELETAEISSSGSVSSVPASDIGQVIGQYATVTLEPGSLLDVHDVTTTSPLGSGLAVVGVALKAGQLPATGVEPGDEVMVVQTSTPGSPAPSVVTGTPDSGVSTSTSESSGSSGSATSSSPATSEGTAAGVLVPQARVFDVAPASAASADETAELVSIEVSSTLAPLVTESAASGQISLVLLPSGSENQ